MRYVVNSTDVNDDYAFFMPLVCRMWRRIGYEPIALMLGPAYSWANEKLLFVLGHTKQVARVEFVAPVQGFRPSTSIQVSRLFAASLLGLAEDDYLLTSDVDMMPLQRDYFYQQDPAKKFHLFNADGYGDWVHRVPATFPICYLGATAAIWREVMGIEATEGLNVGLARGLEGQRDDWCADENLFASKIMSHPIYLGTGIGHCAPGIQLLLRGGFAQTTRANNRIDRVAWEGTPFLSPDMIDCHFKRPAYAHATALRMILDTYCKEEVGWFDQYLGDR